MLELVPFLACIAKEILFVERRIFPYYFNGSLKKLIEKEKPDIVLVLYYTGEFYPNNKNRFMMSNFE